MSIEQYTIAAIIIFAAYFIRGIAGFGSGLVAIPFLVLFAPLTFAVSLILLLDFAASLIIGGFDRKRVQWQEVAWLIPFTIIGVYTGTKLLVTIPLVPLLITLAVFIFFFAIRSLFNIHGEKTISKWWSIPASFIGGIVGALFGTNAPPYVIYLNHRIHDKTLLRATFSALFVMDGIIRIGIFFLAGLLLSQTIWWSALGAIPVMLAALYVGGNFHTGLTQVQITRIIGVLLLLSSISLLIKAINT
ncbi:MAG: Probable membrane transporter protein [uncultured Thiotrichaceae bacterium]|uniref:Probable membrane transporter protein n=1 Tax=uncultured Thiotrichaceae bacterium TaxID=298394 RepID=A0A6S6UBG2_9GAMM|nr:MAG: Probable membrane transporter protein [uncultured Thiotrichaceae bacterium]